MNRRVLLIAAGTAVALVAVWLLLLWSPQGAKLDAARKRQAEAEDANGALALRIERLRDLRARRPELEADLVALRSAVPESPELDDFLLDTDAAADRSGVDITSVSPGKPAAPGDDAAGTTGAAAPAPAATAPAPADAAGATAGTPPSAISLSLDASGGYFQILDFINRLDDLPRIVVVDSLSLSGGGSGDASASGTGDTAVTGGTSSSELTMSITARMFTTAPPAPPEGEAAEAGGATTTTTTTAPSGATAGGAGQ